MQFAMILSIAVAEFFPILAGFGLVSVSYYIDTTS